MGLHTPEFGVTRPTIITRTPGGRVYGGSGGHCKPNLLTSESEECTQLGVPKKDPEMTAAPKLPSRCSDISVSIEGELDEVVCEQHRLSTNEGLRVYSYFWGRRLGLMSAEPSSEEALSL